MAIDESGDFGSPMEEAVQFGGHACEEILKFGGGVRDYEKWAWEPSGCALSTWDAHAFCEALGNRRLLVVGDSTLEQTASTLMVMIRGDEVPKDPVITACLQRIRFAASDTLTGKNYNHMNRGRPWEKPMKDFMPHITILSTGAHIDGLSNMTSILDSVVKQWERMKPKLLKNHTKEATDKGEALRWEPTLVWKTQNPAHEDCGDHHRPTKTSANVCTNGGESCAFQVPAEEKVVEELDTEGGSGDDRNDEQGHWFPNWGQFRSFDRLSTEAFTRAGLPVMDVSFLYGRPDAHPGPVYLRKNGGSIKVDCLHYNCPGPLNSIAEVLRNMLQQGLGAAKA